MHTYAHVRAHMHMHTGVLLEGGSSLHAQHLMIQHAISHGIEVYDECSAVLEHVSVQDSGGSAIFAYKADEVLADSCQAWRVRGMHAEESSHRFLMVSRRRNCVSVRLA